MKKFYVTDLFRKADSGISVRNGGISGAMLLFVSVIIMLLSSCATKEIKVWVASPWQTVLQDTPPADIQSVTLKAAANEYEPFRIIIHNLAQHKLHNLSVKATDLTGSGGVIGASNIQLYRANYLHVTKPSSRSKNRA